MGRVYSDYSGKQRLSAGATRLARYFFVIGGSRAIMLDN
jgi:hypothetical protein